tara:strand:+ start:321 stop:473 length:153 start_codon:yes stop_codon:yes gene_type:complete
VGSLLDLAEELAGVTGLAQAEMVQAVVDSEMLLIILQVHLALQEFTQLIA